MNIQFSRIAGTTAALIGALALLAACSSAGSTPAASTASGTSSSPSAQSGTGARFGGPAASG